MKRRRPFALRGNSQDLKNLQLVKVNKLDFVCQKNEIVIDKLAIEYHQTVVSVRYLTCISKRAMQMRNLPSSWAYSMNFALSEN